MVHHLSVHMPYVLPSAALRLLFRILVGQVDVREQHAALVVDVIVVLTFH